MSNIHGTGDLGGNLVSSYNSISCAAYNVTWDADGIGPHVPGCGWDLMGAIIVGPAVVMVIMALASLVTGPIHSKYMRANGSYSLFVKRYMGQGNDPPADWRPNAALYGVQMVLSALVVFLWITKSYLRCDTPNAVYVIEIFCGWSFTVQYAWNFVRGRMRYTSVLGDPGAIIDAFTIIPILMRSFGALDDAWLNLGFLRAFRVLQAYSRLELTGVMNGLGQFERAIIAAVLRTWGLVTCMAGLTFSFEVLGEIHGFEDDYVATSMGDISFYQCFYWVFTTISTVGYGDYSPTTVPNRCLAIVCIIGGVIFFSIETTELLGVHRLLLSGRGEFKTDGKPHIAVLGGAVMYYSDILDEFLREFLNEEHCAKTKVVIMSPAEPDDTMHAKLDEIWMDNRVTYLMGSPMLTEDQERAKLTSANMVFILSDNHCADPDWEDEQNIIRATACMRANENVRMRLMLLRPENRELALRVGVRRQFCFSLNELKSNLMSQSCRCPGWSTLLLNLAESADITLTHPCHGKSPDEMALDAVGWDAQYCWGESYEIQGAIIADRYVGKVFGDVALDMLENHEVLLFAVQLRGLVMVSPLSHVLEQDDVIFCAARSLEHMERVRQSNDLSRWSTQFRSNRNKVLPEESLRHLDQANQEKMFKVNDRFGQMGNGHKHADSKSQSAWGKAHEVKSKMSVLAQFPTINDLVEPKKKNKFMHMGEEDEDEEEGEHDIHHSEFADPYEMRQKAIAIIKKKNHVILLGMTKGLWQQVIAFIRPLRAAYLARKFEIIVVVPETCPAEIAALPGFEDIAFLDFHPMKIDTMYKVAAKDASKIFMLGGRPQTDDPRFIDSTSTIVANMLENYLQQQAVPIFTRECFLCYEFFDPHNVSLLGGLQQCDWLLSPDKVQPSHSLAAKHSPRYCNGSLLFPAKMGSLLAMAFYTPGIMEIFEAMCIPSRRDQVCMPWRLRVPERYWGEQYSTLFKDVLSGKFTTDVAASEDAGSPQSTGIGGRNPLAAVPGVFGGLGSVLAEVVAGGVGELEALREGAPDAGSDSAVGTGGANGKLPAGIPGSPQDKVRDVGADIASSDEMKALPVGLFRSPGKNGSLLGYVFTSPPMKTVLSEGDHIYCTGPPAFGRMVYKLLQ